MLLQRDHGSSFHCTAAGLSTDATFAAAAAAAAPAAAGAARYISRKLSIVADVAQSVEREALNLVVAGSSPVVGCFSHLDIKLKQSMHFKFILNSSSCNIIQYM